MYHIMLRESTPVGMDLPALACVDRHWLQCIAIGLSAAQLVYLDTEQNAEIHLSCSVLLSIMLFMDELLNVRMGLFAPQWNRAGTGYTMML